MGAETAQYPDYPRSAEMTDHAECVAAFEKYAKSRGWHRSTWWDEWLTWKAAVRWARRPAETETPRSEAKPAGRHGDGSRKGAPSNP